MTPSSRGAHVDRGPVDPVEAVRRGRNRASDIGVRALADEIEKNRCPGASRSRRGPQYVIREILSVCKARRGGLLRRAAPSTKAPTVHPVYIYSNATKHTIARPQVRTISVRSSATTNARRNENAAWACEFYERANICLKRSQSLTNPRGSISRLGWRLCRAAWSDNGLIWRLPLNMNGYPPFYYPPTAPRVPIGTTSAQAKRFLF